MCKLKVKYSCHVHILADTWVAMLSQHSLLSDVLFHRVISKIVQQMSGCKILGNTCGEERMR